MKRKYGFVLGVSVTMGILSLEPRVMAQTDTAPSSLVAAATYRLRMKPLTLRLRRRLKAR